MRAGARQRANERLPMRVARTDSIRPVGVDLRGLWVSPVATPLRSPRRDGSPVREPHPPSATCRSGGGSQSPSSPRLGLRLPDAVGSCLGRLVLNPHHCQAGRRGPLAPQGLQTPLAPEVETGRPGFLADGAPSSWCPSVASPIGFGRCPRHGNGCSDEGSRRSPGTSPRG